MTGSQRLVSIIAVLVLATGGNAASAGDNNSSSTDAVPTFGNRTDKPDGSAALTIGRRLPSEWDTKVGTDVSLAAPEGTVASDSLLRGTTPDRSSGVVWGNLTMPGLRPLGFDKTSVDARVDAGKDHGKLGATLSRSVPIGSDLSVTLQNSYSVTQSLATGAPAIAAPPLGTSSTTAPGSAPAWAADETIRLNINPSGTTVSAGAGSSTTDAQWHNRLSVEQTLYGPLKLTTSVEDAGSAASKKSITAGFNEFGKRPARIMAQSRRCPGICPTIVTVPPQYHVAIAALLGNVIAKTKGSAA